MIKFKIFPANKNLTHQQVSRKRNILSFLLFIFVVICSICVSGGIGVSNEKEMSTALLESSYIDSLTSDVKQYADDLCERAGIPKKASEAITYNKMYEIERSYIYTALIKSSEFNNNAFLANIIHLKEDIYNSMVDSLKISKINIDEQMQNNIDGLANQISNYAKNRVRFENEELFQKILSGTKMFNSIMIGVSVVAGVLIIFKLLSIGNKKYRSFRYAIHSFSGAGLYNIVTVIGFNIYKNFNKQVIYPSYLQKAIDSYTYACTYKFVIISMFLLFISVCIAAICWIMKRRNI